MLESHLVAQRLPRSLGVQALLLILAQMACRVGKQLGGSERLHVAERMTKTCKGT